MKNCIASILILVGSLAYADDSALTVRGGQPSLDSLYRSDQAERVVKPPLPFALIEQHDNERRQSVRQMLSGGKVQTGTDYYKAAIIFQHGESVEDARTAYSLAWIAYSLMPDDKDAKWLSSASWDRMLMRQKKAQWYGTQYVKSDDGKSWLLYNFDVNSVDDQERKLYGVDSASEIPKSFPRQQRPGE